MRTILAAGALVAAASPAFAQQGPWTFSGTLYFWGADTTTTLDTRFGEVETELSFSDALQQLDFAFMGALEASNGQWSILGDVFYMSLSETNDLDLRLFDEVESETDLSAFSAYGFYRVASGANFFFDIGAGVRVYSLDQTLILRGPRPTRRVEASQTWTDPLIAARVRYDFSERWFGTLGADYGGFSSSDNTWNVVATIGYEINDRWSVRGGWRTLAIAQELDNGMDFSNTLSGPIVGVTYRF